MRAGDEVRLVCVGDSFTEGMSDERRADGGFVGWADRTAGALAALHAPAPVRYANLAVRGRLLDHVVTDQLPVALAAGPTLLTFYAGPNDVLRRGTDLDDLCRRYERAVRGITATGTPVLLFTAIGRAGGQGRLAGWLAGRFDRFNDHVRDVAGTYGATLVDMGAVDALTDRRAWDLDRLHLNADGHRRVTAAVLEQLGVVEPDLLGGPLGWWREPLPGAAPVPRRTAVTADLVWARRHLLPWLGRRLTGRSSGDGRSAKDPVLREAVPVRVPPPGRGTPSERPRP